MKVLKVIDKVTGINWESMLCFLSVQCLCRVCFSIPQWMSLGCTCMRFKIKSTLQSSLSLNQYVPSDATSFSWTWDLSVHWSRWHCWSKSNIVFLRNIDRTVFSRIRDRILSCLIVCPFTSCVGRCSWYWPKKRGEMRKSAWLVMAKLTDHRMSYLDWVMKWAKALVSCRF